MRSILSLGIAALLSAGMMVQSAAALDVKLKAVATGLQSGVDLRTPPDGTNRRFIVEQTGTIRILMPDDSIVPEPFLDVRSKLVKLHVPFDERGLLGLAFHPDYKSNGKFYVYYSQPMRAAANLFDVLFADHTSTLAEYKVSDNPNRADPESERILLQIEEPQFNHNGGSLAFGPDGYLYVGLGDGGFADDYGYGHNRKTGNGQDLSNLLGKILRIDVNSRSKGKAYGIPSDNPFVKRENARPEIYAYGFRNPWRMSFDMGGSRSLFVADVQQNSYEEVDIVTKGGNYGWSVKEGTHCFDVLNPNDHKSSCNDSGMVNPIIEYNHCNKFGGKNCKGVNVIGGVVYRGSHRPWRGKYFFGDWSLSFGGKSGRLYVASERGGKWTMEDVNITNMKFVKFVLAVTQDGDGEVYAMTSDSMGPYGSRDTVFKIMP